MRDEARTYSARQDEGQLAALDLLVLGNELHQAVGVGHATGDGGNMDRKADRGKMALDALGLRGGQQAAPGGEREGERHAERNGLAVQQSVGEAGRGLERMAEGGAESEQRPPGGFA